MVLIDRSHKYPQMSSCSGGRCSPAEAQPSMAIGPL
jgi:hypothetical protein